MEKEKKINWKKEITEWLRSLLFVFITVFILTQFILVNARIPTGSMHNTIMTGDRVIAFRFSYWFSNPMRGDVAVFKYPDDEDLLYVKRVVGLPGEIVEIKEGDVYINGAINTQINNNVIEKPKGNFGPYKVPNNSYFMMGDNRENSRDSRYWQNTYVHKDKIVGKVIFRYWPNPSIIK